MTSKLLLDSNENHETMNQIRELRNSLAVELEVVHGKTVFVTSALAGAGKSTVSVNLAASFASQGLKTLLIDVNYSSPAIQAEFNTGKIGLADAVDHKLPDNAIVRTAIDNLDVLSAGTTTDPATLVLTGAFQEILTNLKDDFDYIVIDGGTLANEAETTLFASHADYVLVVVGYKTLPKEKFDELQARLSDAQIEHYGVVFNSLPSRRADYDF